MSPIRRGAAALLVSLALLAPAASRAVTTNGQLQVIHLDAGQGDGAVIITPGGQVVLIDEGTNFTAGSSPTSCSRVLSELQALGVTHVDLHFASHYHADHIGCITSLTGITIDQGWDRGSTYSSGTYTSYAAYLGGSRHTLTKGRVFTLDSLSAHPVIIKCVELAGAGSGATDENSLSLMLKVSYGEFDETFGGDFTGTNSGGTKDVETIVGPLVGPVEVYKVHHHGSATSTNDNWLNATKPRIGIISCGTGNGYGHPTASALGRLHNHSVRTYWTETGTGAAPNPSWDKVAGGPIRINAVWQPGGVDSIIANGIADTLTNSGTFVDDVAPVVSVTSPNGGETVAAGAPRSVTWSATDNVAVSTVDLEYSSNGGSSWSGIASGLGNSGSFSWPVPNAPSTQALVRITAHDAAGNLASDASNAMFSIADQTAPTIAVLSPNGGEAWDASGTHAITWNAADNVGVDSVDVDYSRSGTGGPWLAVQHGIANLGTLDWTLPAQGSDSAVVRIRAFDHALNIGQDASDALFRILPSQSVAVSDAGPLAFSLARPVPNPSGLGVRFEFSLAAQERVRIEVLDVRGRRVWGRAQDAAPGPHFVSWDGRDEAGVPTAQGLYFLRLEGASGVLTRKLVRIR
jgi:beta-lactamase superfamily II metal-dependent hydrolase